MGAIVEHLLGNTIANDRPGATAMSQAENTRNAFFYLRAKAEQIAVEYHNPVPGRLIVFDGVAGS